MSAVIFGCIHSERIRFYQHVGCDNGIESRMKRDRCGVCGGDSSKCKYVKKLWNENCPGFGKSILYFFILYFVVLRARDQVLGHVEVNLDLIIEL